MNPREDLGEPAVVLALAEAVCPSLNGTASFRLTAFLEAVDAGGDLGEFAATAEALAGLEGARVEYWRRALEGLDARLLTVLDDAYPANLRMIHDHPPFLFVRGTIEPADDRAIAVVGTRTPSEEGVRAASEIAGALARRGITVVSGLAEGIDTAAPPALSTPEAGRWRCSGPGSAGSTRRRTARWPGRSPRRGPRCRSSGRTWGRRGGASPSATSSPPV